MYHVYTFGKKSKEFLILTPAQAQTMNEFTKCFFRSQESFLDENGRRWDPEVDPQLTFLVPNDDPQLLTRYNEIAKFCNKQHRIRNKLFNLFRIDVMNDYMDDFLIKRF